MINFDVQHYGYACAKCGLTVPRRVEYVRRWDGWGNTAASMKLWNDYYRKRFSRDAPRYGRDEWLVLTCGECGHSFEMGCADA